MKYLFSMFLLLQYLVQIDLIQINYPAPVDATLIELRSLVEFDKLKVKEVSKWILIAKNSTSQEMKDTETEEETLPSFVLVTICFSIVVCLLAVIAIIVQQFKAKISEKLKNFIKD